jgi:NAD(P)-dependent dehydrogenase (short-subunit alcohol dehydrogenase family)
VAVAVVTGASAGMGRAIARELASAGYDVGLIARGADGLEGAAQDVRGLGRRALALPADVADAAAVDAAAGRAEAELGPIDVWVNNAMTGMLARFTDTTPEEYQRITDVTYMGTVHGTQAALARMKPRNRGTIVQVGSALAYRGIPLQAAYCGAKHAIQGFTESVRCELMHDGIDVHLTMVQLPAHNTPQFDQVRNKLPNLPMPVPPIFAPEVAARGVVWAAQHRRRELWLTANVAVTIAGNALFPGLGDRFLARTGFDDQQREERDPGGRPDYLFEPLPGDRGAHGSFGSEAKERAPYLWATTHRRWLGAAVAAGAAAAVGALARA